MKKVLITLSLSATYLATALPSFAVDGTPVNLCDTEGQFSVLCSLTAGNFGSLLGQLLTLIFVISIVAALFYLVWGGFKWLVSGGDKTAVGAAREHIVAAIIGLVVIFLSYFILNILVQFFTGKAISELVIPTLTLPATTLTCDPACRGERICDTNTGRCVKDIAE